MRPARKGDSLIVCRLSLFGERKEEEGRKNEEGERGIR